MASTLNWTGELTKAFGGLSGLAGIGMNLAGSFFGKNFSNALANIGDNARSLIFGKSDTIKLREDVLTQLK